MEATPVDYVSKKPLALAIISHEQQRPSYASQTQPANRLRKLKVIETNGIAQALDDPASKQLGLSKRKLPPPHPRLCGAGVSEGLR